MELIKKYFVDVITKKYIAFGGTAKRPEFWYFFLFSIIVSIVLGWIPLIGQLILLALLIPSLAVGARRLRDAGFTPWLLLLNLLIGIGTLIVLIICALPSKK